MPTTTPSPSSAPGPSPRKSRTRADLDTLLVSVGGGGLIAGVAAWYQGRARVLGVETEGCPTLHAAVRAGKPVDGAVAGIAADLGAKRIGECGFPVIRAHVAGSLLVSDGEIRNAQRRLWSLGRIVAEPGAAAGLAALLAGRYRPAGEHIGITACGANTTAVDFDR
ncbi:MAG: pyridoxal-phosphate dependent enzyme [Alphaproteobacteria bacterium]